MAELNITSVPGFMAGALHCGIKASGKLDLAMLVSDRPAVAAGVFTTNKIVGAPVVIGRKHIHHGKILGCVINSGCANVCTGKRGLADAVKMCRLTAEHLSQRGIHGATEEYLPFSTGIIGHYLPMQKVTDGIKTLARQIGSSFEHGEQFAQGILTTDTRAKQASTVVKIGDSKVTIAGACKGSGMIAPNMATMLAYIATDADVPRSLLRWAVRHTASRTFNCVTVDQHTSTSDAFVCIANGRAGNPRMTPGSRSFKAFSDALLDVADSLAQQIAADGEGATKLVTIEVTGARYASEAKRAAMAIANSPLVKTAIHGGDPNWGRFVSAAGYSDVSMNVDRLRCWVGGIEVFGAGRPTVADLASVAAAMNEKHVKIRVDLAIGKESARIYTCDLSREYITINADYHT
jgi:glutamate N-acetyltransferase/amino-acid N-acetyltransferase